jgi:hypothetical protein
VRFHEPQHRDLVAEQLRRPADDPVEHVLERRAMDDGALDAR